MIELVIQVDADPVATLAIKEACAMYLEQFGDSKVVEVREIRKQIDLFNEKGS